MSVDTIKVGMIIVMEPELEKSVKFFKDLGFPLKFHLEEKWAEFAIGDVKMGLCPTSSEVIEHHTGVILEVPDVRQTFEEFKAAGVEFVKEPFEAVHGIMCSFKDPGGNIFDLYQPTPDKVQDMIKKMQEQEAAAGKTTDVQDDITPASESSDSDPEA
ncbi:MAG TPA: VOC family protein [Candidatus Babeliales bacterium]|nr:VOC family protein [Candidatus Babeliales bacterium]